MSCDVAKLNIEDSRRLYYVERIGWMPFRLVLNWIPTATQIFTYSLKPRIRCYKMSLKINVFFQWPISVARSHSSSWIKLYDVRWPVIWADLRAAFLQQCIVKYNNRTQYTVVDAKNTSKQGSRSWQSFGKRKKCLQFFRRTRIC